MSGRLLPPEQREIIHHLLSDDPPEILRRRAQVLLLYDEGRPTMEVAQLAGLSRSRTRYWKARYQEKGLEILFPGSDSRGLQDSEMPVQIPEVSETAREGPDTDLEVEAIGRVSPPESLVAEKEAREFPEEKIEAPAKHPKAKAGPKKKTAVERSAPTEEEPPFPKLAEKIGMSPDDPMSEAGRKVMLYHFARMLHHEPGTRRGEDIEELHDMRVATRRMRAAFEVFEAAYQPKVLKKHLKGLRATGRALGRVRDLDVFMEKAGQYLEKLPEEKRSGLDPLLEAWRGDRETARAEMLAFLDGGTYARFRRDFNRFLQTPGTGAVPLDGSVEPSWVREIAPVLIYSRLAAVRAYDRVLASAAIDQLHALRIEFKKLRYTAEYFREVLGEESREVIEDIKTLQDHLGDLNDADVATQILRGFLDEWDARQAPLPVSERQNPEGIVEYLAARHAERHRLMVTFQERWDHFSRPEFRRNLALAVSVL